jgi:hypothetical protein
MIRAVRLDANLYKEVKSDKTAIVQSISVLLLSSLSSGIGVIVQGRTTGLLLGTITALIGWLIWSYFIYIIGTKLFPTPETKSNFKELLRTIGFASSPGIIRVLEIIPNLGAIIHNIAEIWMFLAMVIAVRQALDYRNTFRAFGVCIIGWIIQTIILAIFFGYIIWFIPAF